MQSTASLASIASRPGAPLVFALLVAVGGALGSACGGGGTGVPTTYVCTPPCAAGFTCTQNGCVGGDAGGGGHADLSVALDMAGLCGSVMCAAPTPHCLAGVCVQCAVDDDCPPGNVCQTLGAVTACVPGCKDDARCGGLKTDGGAGQICCGGQCTDPSSDAQNCGACGMTCMSSNASAACVGGTCTAGACRAGWGDCNANPLDGCETNLHTDPKNCKACGTACTYPSGIGGCSDGCYLAGCMFGTDDCNMDPSDGCETSTLADKKNCGSCGNACGARPHGSVDCINANCQLTKCDQGWSDCNGKPDDGCETNTGVDLNNCGRCGNVCGNNQVCRNSGCTCMACNIPNATTKCLNLVCVFDKCLDGYGDCNFNLADGCEVDLTSDDNNCGACGNVCPMKTPHCVGSICTAATYHWKLVESSACNAWCGGQGPPFSCNGRPFSCDMLHVNGYIWIYSASKIPPPNPSNGNDYGWVSWFCGQDGGCRGPGPNAGNCVGGGSNTVWQCVYE